MFVVGDLSFCSGMIVIPFKILVKFSTLTYMSKKVKVIISHLVQKDLAILKP